MTNRLSSLFFAATLLLCACFVHAQVPVAMAPPIHFQFLNSSGNPLAGGKIWTYAAGTTTLQNTYTDASGTTQNTDPILLDATGSPTNGSTPTGIFLSNTAWKFVAFDVNSVQQWTVDNVTTYFALTNSANTWTATQTFSSQIIDTLTDNQMVFGSLGNQATLDFPPPAANITVHMPSVSDTVVGKVAISSGTAFSNGCGIVNGPGTYICVANQNPTGTTLNTLTKLVNAPSQAQIMATTDKQGAMIGIAVAGAGNTGTATIQTSGVVPCVFDGATFAGNPVQVSPTVTGGCRNGGSAVTSIGIVLSTNVGAGTYNILLTGTPPFQPITRDTFNLGSATINAGVCVANVITETGATTGSSVAWAFVGGTPTASDLKLNVYPEARTNQIAWNVCNGTAGNLTQSGTAIVNFTVMP